MTTPSQIGIDWGTSSVRVYDLGPDEPVELLSTDQGIKRIEDSSEFEPLFSHYVDGLERGDVSVVMSGMITSQQGWIQTPYVATPSAAEDIASAAVHQSVGGHSIWAMPGVCHESTTDTDVMRGEETQLVGVLSSVGSDETTVVLPGTHSKWVTVRDGAIVEFATYVTGELFELVRHHSIIGAVIDGSEMDEDDFVRGVEQGLDREGTSGGILHSLFGVRTAGVLEPRTRPGLHSYLSGLLLGTEIAGATASRVPERVTLAGGDSLLAGYRLAFEIAGISTDTLENAAPRGLKRLAEIRGLQ